MSERTQQPEGKSPRSKAKTDLRVLKTQRAIREAFTQLLAEKPFDSITVQNIIDRALVNRKTFYNHFRDKYDLAEQVMLGVGNDLRGIAEQTKATSGANHLEEIYSALQGYRTEVLALWDVKTDREESLSNLLTSILVETYLDRAQKTTQEGVHHTQGQNPAQATQANPSMQLQARLYAAIATASLKFVLESGDEFNMTDYQQAMPTIIQTIFANRKQQQGASQAQP